MLIGVDWVHQNQLIHSVPIFILLCLYIARMLGLFIVLPVLAIETLNYPGYSALTLGLAIGVYGLTQAILQVPLGQLSDRVGRFAVVFVGLLIFALGSYLCAAADSMAQLIIGRALQGAGAISSSLLAWVVDLTGEEKRARTMALIGISIGVSFLASLVIGPALLPWRGLSGLFELTAALAILGAGLSVLLPRKTPVRSVGAVFDAALVREMWNTPGVRSSVLGVGGLHALLMALFLALPSLWIAADVPVSDHARVYLIIMLAGACPAFLAVGWVEARHRLLWGQRLATLAMAAAFGVMALSQHALVLVVAGALFFFAFSLLEATFPSLLAKAAPIRGRGTATGLYATVQFFGAFLGGLIGGPVYQILGQVGLFVALAIACCVWFAIRYRTPEPPRHRTRLVPIDPDVHTEAHWHQALSEVPGVVDVAVSMDERLAYLKVSKDLLDQSTLDDLLAGGTRQTTHTT